VQVCGKARKLGKAYLMIDPGDISAGRRFTVAPLFRPRRCLLLLLLVALTVGVAACSSSTSPSSSAPPSTAEQEQGMAAGLPFEDPLDLNTSTPTHLQVHLTAEPTRFDIGGKSAWGDSYDGSYVGPTMHFAPGEHVTLTLDNKLATATNLHFHGMHVSPSGSADNPYINVDPGGRFSYDFTIPADQPQGTFWYHDHEMCMGPETMAMPGTASSAPSSSCRDVESQIFAGLSGAIVVGDDRSFLPAPLRNITAHTLVFKDMQIDSSGHIVQNAGGVSINSNAPTVRLVNGQLRPVLTMRPGETQLWRLVNAGADIFYDLQLDGYRFTVVGEDGYPVNQVTTMNPLLLPPAKRYDVLVTAASSPGQSWLRTLTYTNGPQGDSYPEVELMRLKVAGAPMGPQPMPTGAIPEAPANLANAPIAQYRTLVLSENAAGMVMFINGKRFDMTRSIFSTPAMLGTVEQWTIENDSGEVHPFHVHTEHFQVMSIDGVPQPFIGQQDIIPVPYKKNGVPGQVVTRVAFTDFTGKVMFHCHIAAHEDAGMMSFVNVVDPPGTATS
jgi:FtsP/CotA-like multicopper oxidase with cupredoxin domain